MEFLPVPGTAVLLGVWPVRIRDWIAAGRDYQGPKSFCHEGPDHPVGNISWHDAQAFCALLSEREDRVHRLPTDHEWSCAVGIGPFGGSRGRTGKQGRQASRCLSVG